MQSSNIDVLVHVLACGVNNTRYCLLLQDRVVNLIVGVFVTLLVAVSIKQNFFFEITSLRASTLSNDRTHFLVCYARFRLIYEDLARLRPVIHKTAPQYVVTLVCH